ncbi:hypothetical protein FNH04_31955 [Streptomyces phyllanthi]|uniref:Uncharacterized protein n=2 Tax=Streptomyces phyllanthi TaxID=1803180 RepID=A0A5N8WC27_9ACTN|nr:hypothetical protein [Streptomyces phyllanthi]
MLGVGGTRRKLSHKALRGGGRGVGSGGGGGQDAQAQKRELLRRLQEERAGRATRDGTDGKRS